MALDIINPIDYPGWNNLILTTKDYSFFHTSNWAKVLYESYNYKPIYFSALDNGHLSLLIPLMEVNSFITGKRGVSLPFSDFCEPIASQENEFKIALNTLFEFGKKSGWRYVEFRGNNSLFHKEVSSLCFFEHRLALCKDENHVFANFRENTKRNARKAFREGVQVKIHNTLMATEQYYNLHCITRKMHGVPPQPFTFFKNIYEHILSKNLGFIILAYYSEEIIAGGVYFHFGEKALFKYGASKYEYLSLRPNHLVMWEAIKWCCQKGFKTFSFGRTKPENAGLRKFKSSWGSKENLINYFTYNFSQKAFIQDKQNRPELQNKLFQNIPLPLLKLLGSLLYKHIA